MCTEHDSKDLFRLRQVPGFVALIALLAAGVVQAQVPDDIEAKLLKIGPSVDPA